MCGIFCYKGVGRETSELLDGLRKLDYRGYDSWGVYSVGDKEIYKREVGRITEIEKTKSNLFLSHCRWATNGIVSETNTHPIKSGKIYVVHNGIIGNADKIKKVLTKLRGSVFKTDTDSEVISEYVNKITTSVKSLKIAVEIVVKNLTGDFAFVLTDGVELIAFRRNTPLVIGVGKQEFFVSSDVQSFLSFTNKVIYLENDSVSVIGDDFDSDKPYEIEKIEISPTKKDFEHFMIKEIFDQINVFKKIEEMEINPINKYSELDNNCRVILTGCGSSYHAALFGERIFREVGLDASAVPASEYIGLDDYLIAITQSGETKDVIDAVKKAGEVLVITNNSTSNLSRNYSSIITHIGKEKSVAATKTFMSQIAVLISLAEYNLPKRVYNNFYKLLSKSSRKKILEVAKLIKKDPIVIGNGLSYPFALEGALKIKEVSYIHSEGFSGNELKHGPIALVETGTPVIALESPGIINNVNEAKSRGAFVIYIGKTKTGLENVFIKVNDVISQIIPLQLLAYELGVLKGVNVDFPRNLAKTVTV
jgi:glucosamine--fructose-6-phosphate aminotransferase (isomerizing)